MRAHAFLGFALIAGSIACGGDNDSQPDASGADASTPFDAAGFPPFDGGTCTANITSVPVAPDPVHRPQGSAIGWSSNPPAGGDHYGEWLRWATVHENAERGNYVHNEEHGGVVLMTPCASGCNNDALAELTRIGRSLPQDPFCAPPINARWVAVRDPLLPQGTAVAAAAWGWTFTATCVDSRKLFDFASEHYADGPEDTCLEGQR